MKPMWLFNGISFLAAFLLFQIELIVAKIFLPNFGGSYFIWGACMVFFQAVLFLGYLYAHTVFQRVTVSRYRYFQLALLILPLFFFPGKSLPLVYLRSPLPVSVDVFWKLLCYIGPVFFALSCVSLVLQTWLAHSNLPQRHNPYSLYAVSNAGSFAALLSYPFFFEMYFGLSTQLTIWRIGYGVLLVAHVLALKVVVVVADEKPQRQDGHSIPLRIKCSWFLLGAAGVILFLSVTNIVTYELTPVPFLWVIPLCIYLLAWVLNFKRKPWCPAWIIKNVHLLLGLSALLFYLTFQRALPIIIFHLLYYGALFCLCMFCQNRIYQSRPKQKEGLTLFYVVISCGGFVGGLFVSWIVPLVSTDLVEFLLGLLVIAIALLCSAENWKNLSWRDGRLLIYLALVIAFWPQIFSYRNVYGLILLVIAMTYLFQKFRERYAALVLSILMLLCALYFIESSWKNVSFVFKYRNYYGIHQVADRRDVRYLLHYKMVHGAQYLQPHKRLESLLYYHPRTPVAEILQSDVFDFQRIGIVGLGAGALTAHLQADQTVDYFELDPAVYRIAQKYFTYLQETPCQKNFIFGDGRIMLKAMQNAQYDLLIVDSFSGDSIPTHLFSTNALQEYRSLIKADGILLFHVTNRFVDTVPVFASNAKAVGAFAGYESNEPDLSDRLFHSRWVMITWDPNKFEDCLRRFGWQPLQESGMRPWSDEYSNVLSVIMWDKLFQR